ncbi:RWD domain-containing protein 4 [Diachasma alloeum]|uniref:RWD domain-containing protein 4 n=1 Tax=Diachasma alloeum TaxID=454923 RepID=UPI0007383977|nr:RWD domain-containing protein 4 [Diachasma alloeum]
MSDAELQEEEREVLLSIYEGDNAFKQLTSTTYQYKFGDDNDPRSFLVEITWNENYPTERPTVNMETFYNKHIIPSVKSKILSHINAEAEQWLGCAMTYTLFQSVQEHLSELIEDQPESIVDISAQAAKIAIGNDAAEQDEVSKKPAKKEQLTKAQKRRQWNRVDGKGDKPRGWDWVDIVKHLSQTGSKPEPEA